MEHVADAARIAQRHGARAAIAPGGLRCRCLRNGGELLKVVAGLLKCWHRGVHVHELRFLVPLAHMPHEGGAGACHVLAGLGDDVLEKEDDLAALAAPHEPDGAGLCVQHLERTANAVEVADELVWPKSRAVVEGPHKGEVGGEIGET